MHQSDRRSRREKDGSVLGTPKMDLHFPILGVWMTPHAGLRSVYFNIGNIQCIFGKVAFMVPFTAFASANRFVNRASLIGG